MEDIELKFGGQKLKLSKAPDAIAIKPRRNIDRIPRAAMHPRMADVDGVSEPTLAGFKVLSVAPESMENTLDTLREGPAVAAGSHVYQTSDDGVPFVPTGEVYVKWKPRATKAEKDRVLSEYK